MRDLPAALLVLSGFVVGGCSQPAATHATSQPTPTSIEMAWGHVGRPQDSHGFGMSVTLKADGQLSCEYSFSGDNWGFVGTTSSTGEISADKMRWLERTFTESDYLALPAEMPSGTQDPIRPLYRLMTSFQGKTKEIGLVPGEILSEVENDRLMRSVDAVFTVCPTRPLAPIYD